MGMCRAIVISDATPAETKAPGAARLKRQFVDRIKSMKTSTLLEVLPDKRV